MSFFSLNFSISSNSYSIVTTQEQCEFSGSWIIIFHTLNWIFSKTIKDILNMQFVSNENFLNKVYRLVNIQYWNWSCMFKLNLMHRKEEKYTKIQMEMEADGKLSSMYTHTEELSSSKWLNDAYSFIFTYLSRYILQTKNGWDELLSIGWRVALCVWLYYLLNLPLFHSPSQHKTIMSSILA